MHSLKSGITAVAAACALAAASFALAHDDGDFPDGFRTFDHVKSMIVEEGLPVLGDPNNPLNVIGLHHIYADKKAMQGYRELNSSRPRTVTFKDGSVIVLDLLNHVPVAAEGKQVAVVEGDRKAVIVMEKDHKRYRDTGGWLFQVYDPVTKNPLLDKATQKVCFACHATPGDPGLPNAGDPTQADFVFSRLRD
jgi:hypothetical protein